MFVIHCPILSNGSSSARANNKRYVLIEIPARNHNNIHKQHSFFSLHLLSFNKFSFLLWLLVEKNIFDWRALLVAGRIRACVCVCICIRVDIVLATVSFFFEFVICGKKKHNKIERSDIKQSAKTEISERITVLLCYLKFYHFGSIARPEKSAGIIDFACHLELKIQAQSQRERKTPTTIAKLKISRTKKKNKNNKTRWTNDKHLLKQLERGNYRKFKETTRQKCVCYGNHNSWANRVNPPRAKRNIVIYIQFECSALLRIFICGLKYFPDYNIHKYSLLDVFLRFFIYFFGEKNFVFVCVCAYLTRCFSHRIISDHV